MRFKRKEKYKRSLFGGVQYGFFFDNGYGASIIRHYNSYGADDGLWELAVLGQDGQITYDTPFTDDVIGYLTVEECNDLLDDIAALEPEGYEDHDE